MLFSISRVEELVVGISDFGGPRLAATALTLQIASSHAFRHPQTRICIEEVRGCSTVTAPGVGSQPLETAAQYQRFVRFPVTFTQQSGTLRLGEGRLTFTRSRGRQVFNGALSEFHSFAPCYAGLGFHIWQGSRCHVVVFQRYGIPPVGSLGVIGLVLSLEATREASENLPRSIADAQKWQSILPPLIVSSPPAGVHVRPPLSTPRYWAAVIGAVVGLVTVALGIVVAAVVLTS
jgi:hypothetical protein